MILTEHKTSMIRDRLTIALQYLLPKKGLSMLAGVFSRSQRPWLKNFLIQQFIKAYHVNMEEALLPAEAYPCFNDFFIRHLKEGRRTISPAQLVCPVDGAISAIDAIDHGQLIQAKGKDYSVEALLATPGMAEHFRDGLFTTLYLSPKDYHRVHMPIDGKLLETQYIPGKLFSVQPITVRHIPQLFARNERLVCLFDTPLGKMAMVLVGATIVGSIGTQWQGDIPRQTSAVHTSFEQKGPFLKKGTEMGYFKLGSTVILLLENTAQMAWSSKLHEGQAVQLGQALLEDASAAITM